MNRASKGVVGDLALELVRVCGILRKKATGERVSESTG